MSPTDTATLHTETQLQTKANGGESVMDGKVSPLADVATERYPSNLKYN